MLKFFKNNSLVNFKIKKKIKKIKFKSLFEKIRIKFFYSKIFCKNSILTSMELSDLVRYKKLRKAFRRYQLFCFIMYCLFLIFCYDVFEDYQFLYLYEYHKWW